MLSSGKLSNKPYKYQLRPAYGLDKLLLEFLLDDTSSEFLKDLLGALRDIKPKMESVNDIWMNDEVAVQVSSSIGSFLLSTDTWGFAFIIAEKDQSCIKLIDEILYKSSLFEKEEVDYEKYKN